VNSNYDDHGAAQAELERDAARYRWLRRRIPQTIMQRIVGQPIESWSEEQLDELLDERMQRSETATEGAKS
jgi:hypothetical protein